jgi:hypothetical protein
MDIGDTFSRKLRDLTARSANVAGETSGPLMKHHSTSALAVIRLIGPNSGKRNVRPTSVKIPFS